MTEFPRGALKELAQNLAVSVAEQRRYATLHRLPKIDLVAAYSHGFRSESEDNSPQVFFQFESP